MSRQIGTANVKGELQMGEQDWKVVGMEAENRRDWISLCPDYPNLKGITCEEIEVFLANLPPDVVKSQRWKGRILDIRTRYEDAYSDMWKRLEEYKKGGHPDWKDPEIEFWYGGKGSQLREELMEFVKSEFTSEDYEKFKDCFGCSIDNYLQRAETWDKKWYPEKGYHLTLPSREFTKEYLKNVVVYNRDEEYEAMKRMGDELAGQIWRDMTLPERAKARFGFADMSITDLGWEQLDEEQKHELKKRILNNTNTIYITTPRGGHEMLSIFAYANDIKKRNIPSDIVKRPPLDQHPEGQINLSAETYGENWLGDWTDEIQRIVFVDDIIASGEQIKKLGQKMDKDFPDAKIYSAHLCHRREPRQLYDWEIDRYNKHAVDIYENRSVYDVETTGIATAGIDFEEDGKIFEPVTCMFPHACPDGKSDWILQLLYGNERCSPERRIARRDM